MRATVSWTNAADICWRSAPPRSNLTGPSVKGVRAVTPRDHAALPHVESPGWRVVVDAAARRVLQPDLRHSAQGRSDGRLHGSRSGGPRRLGYARRRPYRVRRSELE